MASISVQDLKAGKAEGPSPLSFIFNGGEMIIQCIAYEDDEPGALKFLDTALHTYR